MSRASVQLCDDGEIVELGSGTHWVVQEEPERIARLLAAFFADQGARVSTKPWTPKKKARRA